MELLLFGHAGARVLIFPTSKGRFYEWEDRGMMDVLGEHLAQGWLQICCVDSYDAESWYAWWKHPAERAWGQELYDRYLVNEVHPFTVQRNPNPFLMTLGASFGAYHAANFAFRHPELVGRVIGMSGIYDIEHWTDGFHNETVYFHNPTDFLPNEQDPHRLDCLRRMDIILAAGRDDPLRQNSEALSTILWNKDIGNALRLWDGWAHDWPWWRQMVSHYIGGHD
jgi:esterase/lipase superfamily enzyme